MAERQRIGLRGVRAIKPGEIIWDSVVPGFAARRQKGKAVAYILKFRTQEGRQRWHTIGRHGAPWTPDQARDEAKKLLGQIVEGGDPAREKSAKRNAKTVAQLCNEYLEDGRAGLILKRNGKPKKTSTFACDTGRIERHIKPLIGSYLIPSVTTDDIDILLKTISSGKVRRNIKTKARGLARVTGGKTAANRTVGLLGGIFTYAIRKNYRSDNPVRGVIRFEDEKRNRRFNDDEYKALGVALRKAESSIWPPALAATKFLALTGWRTGEAIALRWQSVDLKNRTASLSDTKSGQSLRPLSRAACDLLRTIARSDELVFPASRGNGQMAGFRKFWSKIANLEALPADLTPHTLRHSFASLASDLGYSEPTIGALIGHKGRTSTSGYIHTADAVLLSAADVVADRTSELMGDPKVGANVIELHQVAR